MSSSKFFTFFSFLFFLFSLSGVKAHEFKAESLLIDHPWSYATVPSAKTASGYFTILNKGLKDDSLVSVESQVASRVEIHKMIIKKGVTSMRRMKKSMKIPAGGELKFNPAYGDGKTYHIMFLDIKKPFIEGKKIPAKLIFKKAGAVFVEFAVESPLDKSKENNHSHP